MRRTRSVFGTVATDPTGDVTSLFGEGSDAWNEARASQLALAGTAARTLAQTDLVGIAIHCAKGTSPCSNNSNARPDPATILPGSDNGFQGLFGAKYVNPAIGGVNGCVKATDGTNITDQFGQCGFPGFDGALAKNTLGEVEAMQENGVPVTFAYISDAHDNHVLDSCVGAGRGRLPAATEGLRHAFARVLQRSRRTRDRQEQHALRRHRRRGRPLRRRHRLARPGEPGALTYSHTFCPQPSLTSVTPCPANQIGEVNVHIKSHLAAERADVRHPLRRRADVLRQRPAGPQRPGSPPAGADVGAAQAPDPYVERKRRAGHAAARGHGRREDAAHGQRRPEADAVIHDVRQTPTSSSRRPRSPRRCNGAAICVNPGFAWNHGDFQDEIGNTWVGMVGPGVAQQRHRLERRGPTTSTSGRRSCRSSACRTTTSTTDAW